MERDFAKKLEMAKKAAKKYKNKTAMKHGADRKLFAWAKKRGLLNELFKKEEPDKRPPEKWSVARLRKAYMSCESYSHFQQKHHSLYLGAFKYGKIGEIQKHFDEKAVKDAKKNAEKKTLHSHVLELGKGVKINVDIVPRKRDMDRETLKRIAKRYPSLNDLKSRDQGAYDAMKSRGLLDKLYPGQKLKKRERKKWSVERYREAYKSCRSYLEFQGRFSSLYQGAMRRGVISEAKMYFKYLKAKDASKKAA